MFTEPTAGPALRKPAAKKAKTTRGFWLFNNVLLYMESELENRVSHYIAARNDVQAIYSQYPAALYHDAEGKLRCHIFDYYVVFKDGYRVAVAVKYHRKKEQMLEMLQQIRADGITGISKGKKLTPGVADEVCLMTEEEASIEVFENAQCILDSRHHHDEAEFNLVYDIVSRLPGDFRFGELLRNCAAHGKRRTAVFRLIDAGYLSPVSSGRIDDLTWLRFVG
ncbi:hypothetical protein [Rhizobium leguminosarum]|uniref:hypothetical protein n=1 Tax=Rhizobium leguminosarum TaxID=384 RepID=UPI001FE0EB8A|nr:hypothetical protein [Rhizobium leguminosarum]